MLANIPTYGTFVQLFYILLQVFRTFVSCSFEFLQIKINS